MTGDDFFEESQQQSQIKSAIVKKYFYSWANIMACNVDKIAYIDLFAGQGIYDDGTKSTPILVLENALRNNLMKDKLVALFNDANPAYAKSLENAINSIPDIGKLKFKPTVINAPVSDIIDTLQSFSQVPTLLFVDPWGYKGLTLSLIDSGIKALG